jgi:outer membrane protein assembly factor BamB
MWKADVGQGRANVVIAGDLLYTMGTIKGNNTVSCLRADSGQPVWQYSFESFDDAQATPVVSADSVCALSKGGILLCLDALTGKLRWQKDLVADFGAVRPYYGFAGSPVIVGQTVLITVNTAGMALNVATGDLAWMSDAPPKRIIAYDTAETNGSDYSTPVLYAKDGKTYALIASWKGLSSVEVEKGTPNWVYEWEQYSGRHITDPVVVGNQVFIAQNYGGGTSADSLLMEMAEGRPRVIWKSQDFPTEISNPVIIDGYIYGGQGGPYKYNAGLRCVSLATGKVAWEKTLSEAAFRKCVSLISAAGKLIALTDDGILVVAEASPKGYREISRCIVPGIEKALVNFWVPPVLCNGRVYCKNYYSELVCIDMSK